ncbi:Predicted permease YjgP/YjgQ family [gamma proteobacterium HdN1]|nr:Predicted permease YjgP/YjgQ family [gamma proteobacterium HdN1]
MIIYRYLSRQLLVTTLAVTGVLVLILMGGRFIKYLGGAADGVLTGALIFWVMLYKLPGFLELILPLGLFLGILLSYGRMYLENEMVVLEACGMSRGALVKHTLMPALCTALIVGFIANYVSPLCNTKAQTMLDEQKRKSALELLSPGQFHATRNAMTVTYIEDIDGKHKEMQNLFIVNYNQANPEKIEITRAKRGDYQIHEDTGARYLVMKEGYRFEGSAGMAKFNRTAFDVYQLKLDPPRPLEIEGQYTLMSDAQLVLEGSLAARAELQWRMALPVLVPIIAYLAVILSKVNPRQGRYMKLLPSIVLYLVYLSLLLAVKNKIAKGKMDPELSLWAVHIAFFLLAVFMHKWSEWRLRFLRTPKQELLAS